MKDRAISTQEPPVLSQPSFQQLLSAAFIVQEHNDRLRAANDPEAGYTRTLGEIVETERLIQDPRIDFQTALEIIAERTQQITGADGVAIGLIENGQLVYRADSGNASIQSVAPVSITAALAAECFRSGKILQSPEAENDSRIDQALRSRLGVGSLLAVPVRQEGKLAGILELRFAHRDAFRSQDVRSCQLMAGLLGEVLTSKAKQGWKQALASSEEAAMAAVLEQIQPELDRFADRDDEEFRRAVSGLTQENTAIDLSMPPSAQVPAHPERHSQPHYAESLCQRCGHAFVRDEAFCGVCGAMRGEEAPAPANGKSASWTSLWDQEDAGSRAESPNHQLSLEADNSRSGGSHHAQVPAPDFEDEVSRLAEEPTMVTTSAARPRHTAVAVADPQPEQAADAQPVSPSFAAHLLQEYRATLYLAAAVVLLLVVLIGWGTQPAPMTASPVPAAPELSLVDRMLVNLGLAEAPAPPVDMGNPEVRVWEDIHTALYYCQDSELFGKTKDGKFTKQHDAQLDQFQPASRKTCD